MYNWRRDEDKPMTKEDWPPFLVGVLVGFVIAIILL
jgi:hypothetical protein